MQNQKNQENLAENAPESGARPSKKRLRIAFALAVLIGGSILLFATEFASFGGSEAADPAAAETQG